MIRRRKVKHPVTWRLDRLSRNTLQALEMVAAMTKRNVALHVVDEHGKVRAQSADDEFLLTLKPTFRGSICGMSGFFGFCLNLVAGTGARKTDYEAIDSVRTRMWPLAGIIG